MSTVRIVVRSPSGEERTRTLTVVPEGGGVAIREGEHEHVGEDFPTALAKVLDGCDGCVVRITTEVT